MTWTEELPPMQTKRSQTTALCTGTALIVGGGRTAKPKPKPKKKKDKDKDHYFDSDDEEEMEEVKLTTVEVIRKLKYTKAEFSKQQQFIRSLNSCISTCS